eukprot:scaffold108705_cov22-Tisochrysis_lutea.AAC.3
MKPQASKHSRRRACLHRIAIAWIAHSAEAGLQSTADMTPLAYSLNSMPQHTTRVNAMRAPYAT